MRIDSGPVEADDQLHSVPPAKWGELVEKRRYFLSLELNYDCRCLAQFVRDAEQLWQPLGYRGADDRGRRGYDLEPEESRLAVRWLELNEPESAVGQPEVMARAQRLDADEGVKPLAEGPGNPTRKNKNGDNGVPTR